MHDGEPFDGTVLTVSHEELHARGHEIEAWKQRHIEAGAYIEQTQDQTKQWVTIRAVYGANGVDG